MDIINSLHGVIKRLKGFALLRGLPKTCIMHGLMSCFRSLGVFFFEESKRLLYFVFGMYGEDINGCW